MSETQTATQPKPRPASLPVLDTEAFRRKLAGMTDPLSQRGGSAGNRVYLKETASRLCSILADLYDVNGDDRTKLWEHVGKALTVADEKTTDDDIEHFINECLIVVGADIAIAAAHEGLKGLLFEVAEWSPEIRNDFLNYLRSHRVPVLVFGRAKWGQIKADRKIARDARAATAETDLEGGDA